MNTLIKIIISLTIAISSTSYGKLIVRHVPPDSIHDKRHTYFIDLLKIALKNTQGSNEVFSLEMSQSIMNQERAIASLQKKQFIDVLWTMTSVEREKLLLPIRIPLLKGLLGHRIFIIRKADKEKFTKIKTLKELKQLRAGQGHDWPDTKILQANGFPVTPSPSYEGLFTMLEHNRFDYFPRGVTEVWQELKEHSNKGLILDMTLMLYYPAPIYFFVNKSNKELAHQISKGLWVAIKSGEFDRIFYNHPSHISTLNSAKMENRIIFTLQNPLLPPETPIDNEVLWHKVESHPPKR
ncbi:substrate-binding periplasmic protein [Spartinivicinus ruber]|uniref:substrate-binding periplasmic protein n=1 Tax=Spartinivicinus ruber TaxID=2683272 RepID=UPI0013D55C41|nr:transporter substrate-binding domain-containing protein [Spartinivicinus ruber]